MLDNSVVELGYPESIETLMDVASVLGVHEIVLPDKTCDKNATLEASASAIAKLDQARFPFKVMAAPQGNSQEEWLECALEMLKWPRVATLGISLFTVRFFKNRLDALRTLVPNLTRPVEIHLLGCHGDPIEVYRCGQAYPNLVRGVDTAYRDWETDRKSTRLNSSHRSLSRMPSSA